MAHCNPRGRGWLSACFPGPPPSNLAPRAGPTTSTAGRLKSLKHVTNLANPAHHQSNGGEQGPTLRACYPDPPSHWLPGPDRAETRPGLCLDMTGVHVGYDTMSHGPQSHHNQTK